jgi:hypothetical protein
MREKKRHVKVKGGQKRESQKRKKMRERLVRWRRLMSTGLGIRIG